MGSSRIKDLSLSHWKILAVMLVFSALMAAKPVAAYKKDIGGGHGLFFEQAVGLNVEVLPREFPYPFFYFAFLRFGYTFDLGRVLLGPELAADYSPYIDNEEDGTIEYRHRHLLRVMAFFRMLIPLKNHPRIRVIFPRIGVGLGMLWYKSRDIEGDRNEQWNPYLAMELGGGVEFQVNKRITVGMLMAIPMSWPVVWIDINFSWHATFYLFP